MKTQEPEERDQYPTIFTKSSLVNEGFIFYMERERGYNPERARYLRLFHSGSQSQLKVRFIFPAYRASHIIKIITVFEI